MTIGYIGIPSITIIITITIIILTRWLRWSDLANCSPAPRIVRVECMRSWSSAGTRWSFYVSFFVCLSWKCVVWSCLLIYDWGTLPMTDTRWPLKPFMGCWPPDYCQTTPCNQCSEQEQYIISVHRNSKPLIIVRVIKGYKPSKLVCARGTYLPLILK